MIKKGTTIWHGFVPRIQPEFIQEIIACGSAIRERKDRLMVPYDGQGHNDMARTTGVTKDADRGPCRK